MTVDASCVNEFRMYLVHKVLMSYFGVAFSKKKKRKPVYLKTQMFNGQEPLTPPTATKKQSLAFKGNLADGSFAALAVQLTCLTMVHAQLPCPVAGEQSDTLGHLRLTKWWSRHRRIRKVSRGAYVLCALWFECVQQIGVSGVCVCVCRGGVVLWFGWS